MKALSYWASRHVWQARLLLILIGIFRGIEGILFGFMFLKNMDSTEMNIAACVLFGIIISVEVFFHRRKLTLLDAPDKLYTLRVRCLAILYTSNFLLFMLVGNAVYRFVPAQNMADKTILQSNISSKNAPSVNLDKKDGVAKKRLFSFEKLRTKWQKRLKSDEDRMNEIEFIIVGILLLILSFPLVGFACGAACSGDELLAVVLLLGTIGSFVGGIYFLVKAARISNKRRKQHEYNEEQIKTNKLETHPAELRKPPSAPKPKPIKTPEEIAEAKTQKKYIQKILIILGIAAILALLMFL